MQKSFLPQINSIKMKLEKKQFQPSSDDEHAPSSSQKIPKVSIPRKKNQFVEVYVRVRPFMKFEFRDKHKSKFPHNRKNRWKFSIIIKSSFKQKWPAKFSASSAASIAKPANPKSSKWRTLLECWILLWTGTHPRFSCTGKRDPAKRTRKKQ